MNLEAVWKVDRPARSMRSAGPKSDLTNVEIFSARARPLLKNIRARLLLALICSFGISVTSAFGGAYERKRLELCNQITDAIHTLPGSTRVEDWPELIQMPGLTRPHWVEGDALRHLDVLKALARSVGDRDGNARALPDGSDSSAWDRVRGEWLKDIRNGTMKFESAFVDLQGALHETVRAKLFRLGIPQRSMGTFDDPLTRYSGAVWKEHYSLEPVRPSWQILIANARGLPDLNNLPLYLPIGVDGYQVLIIRGAAYFVAIPSAYMVQYTLGPANGNKAPFQEGICQFNLMAGH